MKRYTLEVTFLHGQALTAYYDLGAGSDVASVRCRRLDPGLIVDYDADDRPLGIEITAPRKLSLEAFNRVLGELGLPEVSDAELAPLRAA